MPTLIGVFAWLNAVEIDEQLSATAPPACMKCLRSITFPLSEHPDRRCALQYKFHATGFRRVLHFEVARLHQHREPDAGAT